MGLWQSFRTAVFNTTTSIVANAIALVSPEAARVYRWNRTTGRSYVAANLKGPYQLHTPSSNSGDREVLTYRRRVNARVKDQERNNPFVAGMIRKNATMVVGDEVGFKAAIEDANGKPNTKLNREIERRFYRWAEHAAIDGDSLTDVCHLVENLRLLDGECIVKEDTDNGEPGTNPFRVQVLESDHIDTSRTLYGYGCEFDRKGNPTAWWLYPVYPDGMVPTQESVRVPASQVCHLFERTRASQRRGISPLASALYKIFAVDDLEDAELLASRAAACFGLIIESPIADVPPMPPMAGEAGESEETPKDDNGKDRAFMDSGGIFEAMPGEKVSSFKNERPNPNFDPFRRGSHRVSSHSIGMSYETATGDYSQVNYSSARMGKSVEWGNIKRQQVKLKNKLLNWIFRLWLRYEIAVVGIPGISVSEYRRNPAKFEQVTWQLSGNDEIDQSKEIAAFESQLRNRVNSRTRWCAERGKDFPEIAKEIQAENAQLEELGIFHDPATVPGAAPVDGMNQDGSPANV